jgi:hypothetical protein
MKTRNDSSYDTWTDMKVQDTAGDKVGKIDHLVYDTQTSRPEFLAVNTGLFGLKTTFVPIAGSRMQDDSIVVPWAKDFIKDAPNVEGDEWTLGKADEQRLFDHYGFDRAAATYGQPPRADEGYSVVTQRSDNGRLRRYNAVSPTR